MAGLPWIPWDVGYFRNPKARAAGKNGRALHLAASLWAADNLTDGIIRPTDLPLLCAEAEVPRATVNVCVREGLFDLLPNHKGWQIHDFLPRNKSRADVEKQRQEWAEKKARQRGESPEVSPQLSLGDTHESLALRQTDRQTVRTEYISDDDDSVDTRNPSSSVEQIIETAAKAIALKDRERPGRGYINGIARNLHVEQTTAAELCIAAGLPLREAAIRIGGDPWFVDKALNGSTP